MHEGHNSDSRRSGTETTPSEDRLEPGGEQEAELPPGTMLGPHHRVVRLLGRGGMGVVYEAEHLKLGRRHAIKILRAGESMARLEREALLTSRCRHPGIVDVLHFGETEDGRPFLVQELLEGVDLKRHLVAVGRLGISESLSIAVQIAEATDAAHRVGVIHRDLKPANIFLCPEADAVRVKVLDFGVAKVAEAPGLPGLTETSAVVGTAAYMAPEQARREAVDARTDVYALGVVLFEMLVGKPPFHGESSVDVLYRHLHEPAPRLRGFRPEVSRSLEGLVISMLSKAPSDRPGSMAEVAVLLRSPALLVRGSRRGLLGMGVLLGTALGWYVLAGGAPPEPREPHVEVNTNLDASVSNEVSRDASVIRPAVEDPGSAPDLPPVRPSAWAEPVEAARVDRIDSLAETATRAPVKRWRSPPPELRMLRSR